MGAHDQRLLKSKQTLDRDQLATMLETLAERMRAGHVRFDQAADSIEVEIPRQLQVDLELEDSPRAGGRKRELEIEISWMVDEQGAAVDAGPGGGVAIG